MNSTTASPGLVRPTPSMTLHYPPSIAWALLEGWLAYLETGRGPAGSWEEDSAISHYATPNQAPWCDALEAYIDVEDAYLPLTGYEGTATGLYWRDGLRSVRKVAMEMHKDMNAVREYVWSGTERMMMTLCGLDAATARSACRTYRERLHMKRVER